MFAKSGFDYSERLDRLHGKSGGYRGRGRPGELFWMSKIKDRTISSWMLAFESSTQAGIGDGCFQCHLTPYFRLRAAARIPSL